MPFDKHVFISDTHLGAFNKEKNRSIEKDLIALIRHCKENNYALYILGDLFDYWMEYPKKGFIPDLGKEVLNEFEDYNKKVRPALYITGNHDNWTYGHFESRSFDVEPNFRMQEIEGQRFLMMHGDGISSGVIDFPRAAFHRLLRSKLFVQIFQSILPPKLGLKTMKIFSSFTRNKNRSKSEVLENQARKIFQNHQLDVILTGHDHIPREVKFEEGTYVNLGTFFDHRSVAVYNNEGLNLVVWDANTENFLPFGSTKETYE